MRQLLSIMTTEGLTVPYRIRRTAFLGAITTVALVGASVLLPMSAEARATATAAATVSSTATKPSSAVADAVAPDPAPPAPGDSRTAMGEFPAEAYAEAAAALPSDLAATIESDLGETTADYLAGADAAANAVPVVDGLTAAGVDVLGSRLEGTDLVVNVATDADANAVEAVNATAEIGAPAPFDDGAQKFEFLDKPDLVGGQGYLSIKAQSAYLCSVAFNGVDKVSKQNQFLTAGHCRVAGTLDAGRVYEIVQSKPKADPVIAGSVLGQPIDSTFHVGDELDSGLIATNAGWTPTPRVGTWNSNSGPVTAGTQQVVRDYSRAIVGQSICKSGRTTGWTCGTVEAVDQLVTVKDDGGNELQINSYISDMCALPGDSGGAVLSGSYAIGVLSTGSYDASCSETDAFTGVFPITAEAAYGSVLGSQPNWELGVAVSPPVFSTPVAGGVLPKGSPMTGTVPNATARYSVSVTIDGTTTVTAAVQPDGSWSADVSTLPLGAHSYSAFAYYASGTSKSSTVTGTFTVGTIERISGADRFDVAVQIAEKEFPGSTTAPVVYVATGMNYPDALSAGPAAVKQGGPLLLVTHDTVPTAVATKITTLAPQRIVIVGGPNSVSAAVEQQLAGLAPDVTVERLEGADRYAASRAVVAAAFSVAPVPHAYAATGGNFPDALSAGGAAGSAGEPVVLVNGGAESADAPTIDLFRTLGTGAITIVGEVNSVRPGVASSLSTVPAAVNRIDGADRFAASINLNKSAFTSAPMVYLATGFNFPDALAGGVLAGMTDSPLYVVPTECVPRGVLAEFQRLGTTNVTLLGGPNSLSPAVAALTPCAW